MAPHPLFDTLAGRIAAEEEAALVAAAIASTWQEIDAALRPVIGQRGVAALYARGVHLTTAAYPWFTPTQESSPEPHVDLAALRAVLAAQSGADAAAGGVAFLQTFYTLLASLVGGSLTDQLLGSAWAHSIDSIPPQDIQP